MTEIQQEIPAPSNGPAQALGSMASCKIDPTYTTCHQLRDSLGRVANVLDRVQYSYSEPDPLLRADLDNAIRHAVVTVKRLRLLKQDKFPAEVRPKTKII